MKACWDTDPSRRPTMEQVIGYLKKLADSLNIHQNTDTDSGSQSIDSMELTLASPKQAVLDMNRVEFQKEQPSECPLVKKYIGKFENVLVEIHLYSAKDENSKNLFTNELEICRSLQSDVIPSLFGFCLEPKLCTVSEYFTKDTLRTILQNHEIDTKTSIRLMLECAKSMSILHSWSEPILHCNINSSTFKIIDSGSGNYKAIINNIIFSKFDKHDNEEYFRNVKPFELQYCAPECFDSSQRYTSKSDVYSFAIIMWEIITKQITKNYHIPYFDFDKSPSDFILAVTKQSKRPTVSYILL